MDVPAEGPVSSRDLLQYQRNMRISKIETFIAGNPWKNWLFTKVWTDEGLYGVGEGTLNYFARTVEAAIHELSPLIVGIDPFQIEVITQRLTRDTYSDGAQIHGCAVAAIEIAVVGAGGIHGSVGPGGIDWVVTDLARIRIDQEFIGIESVALGVDVGNEAGARTLGPIARIRPVRPHARYP